MFSQLLNNESSQIKGKNHTNCNFLSKNSDLKTGHFFCIIVSTGEVEKVPTQADSSHAIGGVGVGPTKGNKKLYKKRGT